MTINPSRKVNGETTFKVYVLGEDTPRAVFRGRMPAAKEVNTLRSKGMPAFLAVEA